MTATTRGGPVKKIVLWFLITACLIQLGVLVLFQKRSPELMDVYRDQQEHHGRPSFEREADEVRRREARPAGKRSGERNGPLADRPNVKRRQPLKRNKKKTRSGTRPRTDADPLFPESVREASRSEMLQQKKSRDKLLGRRLHTLGSPCGPPRGKDRDNNNGNGNSTDCASVKLPMTTATDPACLPRLVLFPSFPTSGNGMTQTLFRTVTGLATGEVYRIKGTAAFWKYDKDDLDAAFNVHPGQVCGSKENDGDLTLPRAGRVWLAKSHGTWPERRTATTHLLLSHVVRLVRNPGDNVLRNAARWSDQGCDNRDTECFRRAARSHCGKVVSIARNEWARHHDFWSTEYPDLGVPTIVVRYERLSVPATAAAELRRMLAFVGENDEDGWVATPESAAKAKVVEPAYEQGTLLAAVCGIETAREMRRVTKRIDDELGYAFDDDRGAWYLPSSSSSLS